MESKGKDPEAVGETDVDLVKLDVKRLLKASHEKLVSYYLKSKILGINSFGDLIPEVNIYEYEPWNLASFVSNEEPPFLFFCPTFSVKNRETKSGYWKKVGSWTNVMSRNGRTGFKLLLVYYRGKPPIGLRTRWIMYEFRLDPTLLADQQGVDPNSFVLFRISNLSPRTNKEYRLPAPAPGLGPGLGEDPVDAGVMPGSFTESITLDHLLEDSSVNGPGPAGGSGVQNDLELGSDSESDSSISELIEMFQPPENEWMHDASTSSSQQKMYADEPIPLEFVAAPVAWEWLRGQVGDVIDSPEIKPFAQQVVEICRNSPLIISVVGSALTAETSPVQWWLAVQRLGFRRRDDLHGSFNSYIRYCYSRLKSHDLKICFLYSALILVNKQIHISVLVKFFIVEGLLGGTTIAAYKRANDIVGLLVNASLLEASNGTMMVKMHDKISASALEILSSNFEGCQMFLGRGLGNLEDENFVRFLIKVGDQLKEPPPLEDWEEATIIFLMDNDFSTLPSKPNCPTLVSLFLQRNRYLRAILASFFDSMQSLTNLDLSQTRIRSLPDSLLTRKSLQVLLLRDCEHLITLPSAIGQLTSLQVLDLQGTQLLNLPDTISELASLKSLKVSFYGSINHNEYNNLPRKLIGDGIISKLPLEELGMFVHPGDRRWTNSVSDISKEVSCLLLDTLYFHFPKLESLEYFLRGSESWKIGNLTDFNFIVGHDFKHALSLVTRDGELMHSSSKRCLRFVNGETSPQQVVEVLKRATSLYLDHHFSICFLSEFGINNMDALKILILSDCPEVQAIIHPAEDGQSILPSLEYLSLNSLWNLEAIISGHHLFAEESFNMLTFLSLRACPKLTYVFSMSTIKNLPKLEELVIEDCASLKYILSEGDMLGSYEFAVLPSLKVVKLYYLPNLCEFGRLSWPKVEHMYFYNCPKLKNLCMTTDDTANIIEIAADKAWWDSLEWDEPLLSERLDKLFTQIKLDDL